MTSRPNAFITGPPCHQLTMLHTAGSPAAIASLLFWEDSSALALRGYMAFNLLIALGFFSAPMKLPPVFGFDLLVRAAKRGGRDQLPRNVGFRFSTNAVMPSF